MKTPFVLASVQGGTMILNCLDASPEERIDGPGADMLRDGIRDPAMMSLVMRLADSRRATHGDGVVLIDGGANVGSFTVPWARHMQGWGTVIAFEPQRWVHMALCGNVIINNCFNVDVHRAALGNHSGGGRLTARIPRLDPSIPCNSGGVQVGSGDDQVPLTAIDFLGLDRCDVMKLDLEGMEPAALEGAMDTIGKHKPIIVVEHFICGLDKILAALPGYNVVGMQGDVLCVHRDDNPQLLIDMEKLAQHLNYETVRCTNAAA